MNIYLLFPGRMIPSYFDWNHFIASSFFTRCPGPIFAFFLLLNTAPLNAAVINSVGAHIRATALAVNIFFIHLLGDVPSPAMMGWVADKRSLQAAFVLPVIAMGVSSAILFYGMRFAPPVALGASVRAGKS